ncbi:MAG: hypothetical protein OEW58_01360 [Gammaproteobacteria bacterium]|nr:hypothetical protein [Gammaproteobacteria bacterium]
MAIDTYGTEVTPQLDVSFDNLRDMIGMQVRYRGVCCQIVEVIEEDFSLVLADLESHLGIQADQHGEAHRKVPKTYTVHIYNPDKKEFSSSFLTLEPVDG